MHQDDGATPEPDDQQQEGLRPQSVFVSLVAHELRTPLTAVKGYVELLLEDAAALSEEHQEFLRIIKTNTDRLVDLYQIRLGWVLANSMALVSA